MYYRNRIKATPKIKTKMVSEPTIYGYTDSNPQFAGMIKVGYTAVDVAKRVAEQYPTKRPGIPVYKIVFMRSAIRKDGTAFTDRDVHEVLGNNAGGEWFNCTVVQLNMVLNKISDVDMTLEEEQAYMSERLNRKEVQRAAAIVKFETEREREWIERAERFHADGARRVEEDRLREAKWNADRAAERAKRGFFGGVKEVLSWGGYGAVAVATATVAPLVTTAAVSWFLWQCWDEKKAVVKKSLPTQSQFDP